MNCNHRVYKLFIQCHDSTKTYDHLHCITCGSIITNESLLTILTEDELKNSCTIYKSRYTCKHIISHL